MTQATIGPVSLQERIQAIDIIRGFALLGVLIISFTVDDAYVSPQEGWTGFGDQLFYWLIKLLMDNRFQSTYCFLFGLGFVFQMQRAAARNSFFGVAFLRRMIALYLIMIGVVILSGKGYNVLPYYAMIGVLLLLFWKVPAKILPFLALFFFLLPWTRHTIDTIEAESKIEALNKKNSNIDTSFLDKFVGVYEQNPEHWVIIMRKGSSLYFHYPTTESRLIPISDTSFAPESMAAKVDFYFIKDSTGKNVKSVLRNNLQEIFTAYRINKSISEGLKKLDEQRAAPTSSVQERPNYSEFVNENATSTWKNIQNLSLQNFLWWRNDYTIGYILVLFLLGLYAGKRKIFYNVPANQKLVIKVFKWGMIVGGAGIAISLSFEAWNFIQGIQWHNYSQHYSLWTIKFINLLANIGSIIMALGYIAGLTLLLENSVWKKRLSFFAPVGRMGFTNYILLLFAYMLIFDKVSWFWGLEAKIGCLYRLLLAISVYVILYFFSKWWLKHFRYGPFEWLWRSLTYLKFQPMRLETFDKK